MTRAARERTRPTDVVITSLWLSLALVILAIVAMFVRIPYLTQYVLWVAVIGYAILVIGCRVKTA